MLLKKILPLSICLFSSVALHAQVSVNITIDTEKDRAPISPYIFGSNGHSTDKQEGVTARRQGGNRLAGYNWETNASHAGVDYLHQNDNYLTWNRGIGNENEPGIVMTAFHDTTQAQKAYTLLTLQAAGYVSADKNGPVAENETAPSGRFKEVVFKKTGAFQLQPDLNDNRVYMDELVNLLISKYGNSTASPGIKGYAVDNEPGIWSLSHPKIHPQKVTVAEMVSKTRELSKAVKAVDPTAEIFGGTMYGFSEIYNLQDAPDWDQYKDRGTYFNALLDEMKKASDIEGKRLMDVIDVHWYPEARGLNDKGEKIRIAQSNDNSEGVARARIQSPRSLWDSTYQEDSWIGQYFSPVALLPSLKASIAKYNPSVKLAITEYNYGGEDHISGGIALADQFGLFAKYGVYMANMWDPIKGYNSAAFKMYRNYDGIFSTFGDTYVFSKTSDNENSSVYASVKGDSALHIILINKNFTQPLNAAMNILAPSQFTSGRVWVLDKSSSDIRQLAPIASIADNLLNYSLPPLTVAHIILQKNNTTSVEESPITEEFLKAEVRQNGGITLQYSTAKTAVISVYDLHGNLLKEWTNLAEEGKIEWRGDSSNGTKAANGIYLITMRSERGVKTAQAALVK